MLTVTSITMVIKDDGNNNERRFMDWSVTITDGALNSTRML